MSARSYSSGLKDAIFDEGHYLRGDSEQEVHFSLYRQGMETLKASICPVGQSLLK